MTDDDWREKYDSMLENNYLEDQNDIRMSFDDNNTASRRDFKLEQNEKSDALSNRIFERFEFD